MEATVIILSVVVLVQYAVLAYQSLSFARSKDATAREHVAQIDRLALLQRSESLAEFAAAEKVVAASRLEMARDVMVAGEPAVAVKPKARSNLGIWARYRAPVKE